MAKSTYKFNYQGLSGPSIPISPDPNLPPFVSSIKGQSRDVKGQSNNYNNPSNSISTPLLGEESNLRREAFNRRQFDNTIDTSFNELGVVTKDVSTFDPSLATVGDFFTIYNTLFYQIPKVGDVNSHEFLITESIKYTQFLAREEEIAALLAEIDELRTQNLELIADMSSQIKNLEAAFTAASTNAALNTSLL
tara:strand:+ start:40 stop:618 length:579 start_codon:yes stop_codon:yes gene_type:complete